VLVLLFVIVIEEPITSTITSMSTMSANLLPGDGVFYSARSARMRRVGSTITRADAAFRYRGRLQVMLMLSSCHLLTGCETAIWIVAVCAG